MIIGIPKETNAFERRVSITPETVKKLISSDHTVLIEKGAGEDSFILDNQSSLIVLFKITGIL